MTIDMLPDDVFLPIFHFDRVNGLNDDDRMNLPVSCRWHRLVHVCRRWRSVGFASPNSLQLILVCHPDGDACLRQLGIWPPLPIIIRNITGGSNEPMWKDYVIDVATAHHNRICAIDLAYLTHSEVRRLASTMRKQFPALIHLALGLKRYCGRAFGPHLPDGFLGGSAPRLQTFKLQSIPFPALPKLLLSATDLVILEIRNVPYFGYTSFEVMVAGLAASTNLKYLIISFKSALSFPDLETRRSTPPDRPTRSYPSYVRRRKRILGGPRGPDRCPFAGLRLDLPPSIHIRHSTNCSVHQAHDKV